MAEWEAPELTSHGHIKCGTKYSETHSEMTWRLTKFSPTAKDLKKAPQRREGGQGRGEEPNPWHRALGHLGAWESSMRIEGDQAPRWVPHPGDLQWVDEPPKPLALQISGAGARRL